MKFLAQDTKCACVRYESVCAFEGALEFSPRWLCAVAQGRVAAAPIRMARMRVRERGLEALGDVVVGSRGD